MNAENDNLPPDAPEAPSITSGTGRGFYLPVPPLWRRVVEAPVGIAMIIWCFFKHTKHHQTYYFHGGWVGHCDKCGRDWIDNDT